MIIEFRNVGKILLSELLIITKFYEELQKGRENGVVRQVNFVVSNNAEMEYLEINIKLAKDGILRK